MHVSQIGRFLTIRIFLRGKSDKAFFEKVNLQWVESWHQRVDPQIILKSFDQVGIAHVLRDNIAWLSLHFLLLANDFNATTARRSAWLHDVHMSIVFWFSIHRELSVVIREQICLWAEIELSENSSHPTQIFPHHIFAAHLERLGEMVHFLVLSGFFEVLRFSLASPHHVPFGAVRTHDSETCCLQCIDDWVVNMRSFRNFKS